MKKKRIRTVCSILMLIILLLLFNYVLWYKKCDLRIWGFNSCDIGQYIKIIPVKFNSKGYESWKKHCEYVNTRLNCGRYDCSEDGYIFNHDLCWH